MRSTILCVDDDKMILTILSEQLNEWLGENYIIEKALSGHEALEIIDECTAEGTDVSLVISDYMMPVMKGDALLEQVKLRTPKTRRIMLTGYSALEGIANAINKAGIYRYLSKPWDTRDMMLTVLQAIRSYEQDKQTDQLNERNKVLCNTLNKIVASLQVRLQQTISSLSTAVELREGSGTGHAVRTAKYAIDFAESLGLSQDDVRALETAALLHEFGKLSLSDTELESVRNLKCYDGNQTAAKQAENARSMLGHLEETVINGVMYHAERADGKGAFGMNAASIPLFAKIICMCDYYDTLSTASANVSHENILAFMEPQKSKIFDTALYDKFSQVKLR